MAGRPDPGQRMRLVKREGGKEGSFLAVPKGLKWLAAVQSREGSWGSENKGARTGMALLAFLGHYENQDSEEFGDNVIWGIRYLLSLNEAGSGQMATHSPAYETGIATYALAEAYIQTRNHRPKIPGIKEALEKSIKLIVDKQRPDGGWDLGYSTEFLQNSDTSLSVIQIKALVFAKLTGLEFEGLDHAMKKAMANLLRVRSPNGTFGKRLPGDSDGQTSAAIFAMQLMQWWNSKLNSKLYRKEIQEGINFLQDKVYLGKMSDFDQYEWYYTTQACFHQGGTLWANWNKIFRDEVVAHQLLDGHWQDWSADEAADPGSLDNQIMTTTLCLLMLETYYRYKSYKG